MLRELSVRLSTGRGHWCKGRNVSVHDAEPSAVAQREKRHQFVLWGGQDSNLRSTDYESGWKSSVELNLAQESESRPGSSAEFGGVGD